jgi:hypothetical protein
MIRDAGVMSHRYGRHGNKAWLHWRQKRFRRPTLTLAPQVAVLHVPLEFLSRIRKVTIFMSDGTEETVEITTNPLSPPIVDADPIKRLNGSEPAQSPQDRFFAVAKEIAEEQAQRTFRSTVDPYHAKLHVQEARALVQSIYYGNDNIRLAQQWSLSEAQEQFLREFRAAYGERLFQLSIAYEAPTEETQQLLVFARTDKIADESASPTYAQDRAFARAYISLFSDISLRQEDIREDVLSDLRKRTGLYQKFYEEFEPAQEED